MKTLFKTLILSLAMFVCCQVVNAETTKDIPSNIKKDTSVHIYKTETAYDIIYIVDKDGKFQYSWKFSKAKLDNKNIDIDFLLNFESPYKKAIDKALNNTNVKKQYLSFAYHGSLPADATIKVKVNDEFKDDDHLTLYYYNENKLEYIAKDLIVKNGCVEFKISHCSDYLLTASIIKTAVDNPQSMGVIIIVMIIIVVILIATTLFRNK